MGVAIVIALVGVFLTGLARVPLRLLPNLVLLVLEVVSSWSSFMWGADGARSSLVISYHLYF